MYEYNHFVTRSVAIISKYDTYSYFNIIILRYDIYLTIYECVLIHKNTSHIFFKKFDHSHLNMIYKFLLETH